MSIGGSISSLSSNEGHGDGCISIATAIREAGLTKWARPRRRTRPTGASDASRIIGLSQRGEVTALLSAWRAGDRSALERLIPIVYEDFRRMAARHMRAERPGHTLQATALVHEAYLRLICQRDRNWEDRAHFFAVAAQVMRNLLVDYARTAARAKRGGGWAEIALDGASEFTTSRPAILLALDDALCDLAKVDPRASRVVELRHFAGLSNEEVAEVLGVSSKTVMRDWNAAKLWLRAEIRARKQSWDS